VNTGPQIGFPDFSAGEGDPEPPEGGRIDGSLFMSDLGPSLVEIGAEDSVEEAQNTAHDAAKSLQNPERRAG